MSSRIGIAVEVCNAALQSVCDLQEPLAPDATMVSGRDPSAEATFNFMIAAGIPREDTVTWNVVPGWNGTRKITGRELREGVAEARNLLALLLNARTVVLVGRKAARAGPLFRDAQFSVFESLHPSPLVRASRPEAWADIPRRWADAYAAIAKFGV